MNKWKCLLIYVLFAAVMAVIVFMVWVGTANSQVISKYQREYLPVMFANALPTPAPTMDLTPEITYPPPVTPVFQPTCIFPSQNNCILHTPTLAPTPTTSSNG